MGRDPARDPVRFLLIEDDPDHAWLVSREFELHHERALLQHFEDAEQALAYLRGDEPFDGRPRPDVVLVDLNLPRKGGFEVLSAIHDEPRCSGIHTVVLTTSSAESDRLRAARHAEAFITKPVGLLEFRRVIGDMVTHWIEVCGGEVS